MRVLGKGKTALAIKELYKDVKLYDDNDINTYDEYSLEKTIVSPGIPPYNEIVKKTKNIISDYDLFLCDTDLETKDDIFTIWISGTNGKTTTTKMCEHLLRKDDFISCGNIGLPLASAIKEKYTKLLIETSSYTLHYTSYAKPNIYILLEIKDDHLSWHGSFEEYEKSKLKPLNNMNKNDIAIIPHKYKDIKTKAKLITYKNSQDLSLKMGIDISKLDFKEPFLQDALLALSVEKLLFDNCNYDCINTFIQDEHKLEEFENKNGILYVNDSKATNVDAAIWALKTYKNNNIHIILGGDDKQANLTPLFEQLKLHNLTIYAIGSNTNKLDQLSKENNIKCIKSFDLLQAIKNIKNNLNNYKKNKTVILLSPAASSYDQFDSYKQRGEIFKKNILV